MSRALCLAVLAFVASACRVPPKGGLDEVSQLLHQRGAGGLRWNQSLREDDDARAALDRILAEELTPARAVQIALVGSPEVVAERMLELARF